MQCVKHPEANVSLNFHVFAIEVIFVTCYPFIRNIFGWTDLDFSLLIMFLNVSHVFPLLHLYLSNYQRSLSSLAF